MYDLIFTRMAKPWLHPDIIFNLTATKHKTSKLVKILEDFVTEVTTNTTHIPQNLITLIYF